MPNPNWTSFASTPRFLSVDMVQNANSGHPGLPMGAAPMAYVLWTRFLSTIRPIRNGSTATASCYRRVTVRCCSTACFTSPATTCRSTTSSASGSGTARRPDIRSAASRPASRSPPGRSGRASPTRSAWRSPRRTRGALQPPGPRDRRPPHLRDRQRRRPDGRRASEAASLAGHLQLGKLIFLYDENSFARCRHRDRRLPRIARGASKPTAGTRARSPTATTSTPSKRRSPLRARKPRGPR